MAYRNDIGTRNRGAAMAAVIAIHAALLFALLHLSAKIDLRDSQAVLSVFNLKRVQPPPHLAEQPRPKHRAASSAPRNIRSQATPVAAPKPLVQTPPVQQVVASAIPRTGAAATQGTSQLPGPGTGGGGKGNGNGNGSGNGAGGGNEAIEPPHLATSVLTGRDFPRDLLDRWPRGATVFLRLRVDPRGYVAECTVDRGTGVASIDGEVCNLAHERLRFRPALNGSGQAVAGWFGYAQPAPR